LRKRKLRRLIFPRALLEIKSRHSRLCDHHFCSNRRTSLLPPDRRHFRAAEAVPSDEKGKNEVPDRAYGHTKKDAGWIETDQSPTSAVLGGGGIYSSIDDLAKWDRALGQHPLLSAAEMQPALTPVEPSGGVPRFRDGGSVSYGFGWFLDPHKGRKRMSHDGGTVGFRTTIERSPDDNLTVIVPTGVVINPEEPALRVADLYFPSDAASK
jgi:CubicO group peptidase (beta-lactamase class C family)